MKYSCEVIRDLLPLYVDNCCSPASRRMVEEHLTECEVCKQESKLAVCEIFLAEERKAQKDNEATPARIMKRGMKKIARTWAISLMVVVLLIPTIILSWNQVYGTGIGFANLNELWIAHLFMDDIAESDYEAAFRHLSIESVRNHFQTNWFEEEDLVNLEEDAKAVFISCAKALDNAGGISDYKFVSVYETGKGRYWIKYLVTIAGVTYELKLDVDKNGVIYLLDGGAITAPSPLTTVGLWREYLWNQYAVKYLEQDEQGNVFDKYGIPVPMAEYWKYAPIELN